MDTSKQYIKMCDCDEIQGNIKRDAETIYYIIEKSKRCTKCEEDFSYNYKFCCFCGTILNFDFNEYISSDCIGPHIDTIKIIPRQDQLQDMICHGYSINKWLKMFVKFVEDSNYTEKSMEQLWLAYVMHEKFNKKWDGNKWS